MDQLWGKSSKRIHHHFSNTYFCSIERGPALALNSSFSACFSEWGPARAVGATICSLKKGSTYWNEDIGKLSFPIIAYPYLATWTARSDW